MNATELFEFLSPQAEPLQLGFFLLILVMMLVTISATHWYARDASWAKKWNNGTLDDLNDDLDIDHGSVTDLWHAVETSPEKLAEIMPGLLLVVGLLGTFLGLGLALNHASNILGQSNALSAAGAADSMQQLTGMMHGLGTKFKTSTWGITGFLLLKIWSSVTRFDEKRLKWVILKVKTELEQRKIQLQKADEIKQQALFTQISQASGQIIQGFAQNLAQLSEHQKTQHEQTLQYLQKTIQVVHQDLTGINSAMQSDNSAIKLALEQNMKGVREDLAIINSKMQSDSAELKQTLEQTAKVTHEDLAGIHSTMQSNNVAMKQALEHASQDIHKDLASINAATQASSQNMSDFVGSTKAIIQDMSAASSKMADGAHQVGAAGSSLVKAVDDFSTQFTQVLGDVRTDLSMAINNMSEQAAQTLEQGSKELGNATEGISKALGVLSCDVTTTMNGVKDSMEKSLKIQERGAVLFKNSSESLNEQGEVIKKLGDKISSGLEAVSDASRRMAGIGKSLETIVPQMGDLLPALEPLKTLHTQHQLLLDETKALRADLSKLDSRQAIQSLEQTIQSSQKARSEQGERQQQSPTQSDTGIQQ
ncbi:MAG: hypothetical protein ABL885_13605 [Methylophilaceae bacterium]